jgi:glycosyltransferase involved in cell wall biosynthesis
MLRGLVATCPRITWLPVPSNLAARPSADEVARLRGRIQPFPDGLVIGHFSTFGTPHAALLAKVLPPLLLRDSRRTALLLGRGGDHFARRLEQEHPALQGRLVAPGDLPESALVNHLAVCDVLVQTYIDGASTRRTSLMAGLSLGLPIATTEGPLSEPLWRETGAVALAPVDAPEAIAEVAETLLADGEYRAAYGLRARALYENRFGTDRMIQTLRGEASGKGNEAIS